MSGRERKEGPDVLSDIEIAQATKPQHISAIAEKAGVPESYLELYGTNKAKVDYNLLTDEEHAPGKLILVTAINPTPAGEGKTTTTVGLADALARQGKNVVVALREPSLGPVFGVKGGAAGGGYAQVIPMEDINLHFTGDFHAIGAANNLLAAMLDNHIQQGNELGIDVRKITWKRVVDMNDRQLRNVVDPSTREVIKNPKSWPSSACPPPSPTSKSAWPASSWATRATTSPSRPATSRRRAPWPRC